MKLGILTYSSDTGLGNQMWEIYKHLNPTKTLVVDLSRFNQMPTHHDRYKDAKVCGFPSDEDVEWLVNDMDIVFVAETPLNYHLFEYARQKGVKTIQQYNAEFLDYYKHPDWAKPTILAAPTKWYMDRVEQLNTGAKIKLLPVPVNTDLIPFREIKECKTFIHIIGRPAYEDRNGTIPFLQAALRLGRKYSYKIFLQPPSDPRAIEYFEPVRLAIEDARQKLDLEIIENVLNYQDIYTSGDVLVLPRRYGGLCLPMQEALAAGMPVLMTDISPNFDILSKDCLIEAKKKGEFEFHAKVDVYEPDYLDLVQKMDDFSNPIIMQARNKQARMIAETISWNKLKQVYLDFFENA